MNIQRIANNDDLAQYLLQLGAELRSHGCLEVAQEVHRASQFAGGSPSEFLYETEEALKKVVDSYTDVLPQMEVAQVARVLKQIRAAFNKVGGA